MQCLYTHNVNAVFTCLRRWMCITLNGNEENYSDMFSQQKETSERQPIHRTKSVVIIVHPYYSPDINARDLTNAMDINELQVDDC